jgi:CelD/BcsL family acetyltransferase involved in cellulose biosynthesis
MSAWDALARSCPWTTPFQRPTFSRAWYSTYTHALPVLAFRMGDSGDLSAMFPLALFGNGRLSVAGAEQAEYQGWIAESGEDEFIGQALDGLASRTPAARLVLRFLPPGIPRDALDRHPRWGRRQLSRTVARGLMRTDPANTAKALKKSGNRSKMNRLRQLGPVRLDRVTHRTDLERVIDEVAAYCDVRQCAVNGVMPFHDDPLKREFCLRLLEEPGLLHATVLHVGDHLAAAHLGVASARDVALGVIAYSPFLAAHSPGKLLMLLLSERMSSEGFEYLDLTPEGSYKDRFATHSDDVEIREIFFRRFDYLRARALAASRSGAKRAILGAAGLLGLDRDTAVATGRRWGALFRRDGGSRRSRVIANPGQGVVRPSWYRLAASSARLLQVDSVLERDRVGDLQWYDLPTPGARTRQEFCRVVLNRLEIGHHLYTRVEGVRLVHVSWLTPLSEGTQPGATPMQGWILEEEFTHPAMRQTSDLVSRSVLQRSRDAGVSGGQWVYVAVPRDHRELADHLVRQGFEASDPPHSPDATAGGVS